MKPLRPRKPCESWIFRRGMLAYWPTWRSNCTRSLDGKTYYPMRARYRKPWHPYAAYFYRRGFTSGPPHKLTIFRNRMRQIDFL